MNHNTYQFPAWWEDDLYTQTHNDHNALNERSHWILCNPSHEEKNWHGHANKLYNSQVLFLQNICADGMFRMNRIVACIQKGETSQKETYNNGCRSN